MFNLSKTDFRNYIDKALADEENGEINHIALGLLSAWTKRQTDFMVNGRKLSKTKDMKEAFGMLIEKHKKIASILKKVMGEGRIALLPQEETFLVSLLKDNSGVKFVFNLLVKYGYSIS